MNPFSGATALACALSLSACATAMRGPNVDFHVVTDPPGATVMTDLETPDTRRERRRRAELVRLGIRDELGDFDIIHFACDTTPCDFELPRRSNFTVHVEREGYHPATIEVTSGFGQGGATKGAVGSAAAATGAYVVAYNVVHVAGTVLSAGLASTGAVASSAAGSAATGVGVLALGVDVLSGAMLDLRPNPLVLVLIPEDQPLPEDGTGLIETEEEWQRILEERDATPADTAETGRGGDPVG
ncbi:MAG: hypothetical protein AAFX86_13490 [Pseudomonadota bacterium]